MKRLAGAFLLKQARDNWLRWQDVYEYKGNITMNPLLAYEGRFASFLREYGVGRTIRKGRRDALRRELRNSPEFRKALEDGDGQALDRLARDLGSRFGSRRNAVLSALSKVAAFIRPERFVAWDQFARKGLKCVLRGCASSRLNGYSEYLAAFDTAWEGQAGGQVRDYVAKRGVRNDVEREPRFLRRVLDVYLMKRGGRWSRKARPK